MTETCDPDPPASPPGLLATVTAAVAAGLTVGLLFGVLDALFAGVPLLVSDGEVTFALGCLAATVMTYSVAATIVLVLVAALLHPLLRRYCEKKRLRRLLILGGWLAIWIDLFLGLSDTLLPERAALGAGAVAVEGAAALLAGVLLARLLVWLPAGLHAGMRTLAVIAIAGGWYFVQGHDPGESRSGAIGERNRDLPNVLFLVADALPAGELSCYGNATGETPFIDALADRGVLIESCYVPSPLPEASLAAIATGGLSRVTWWEQSLPALVRGARRGDGEQLERRDYATAAFLRATIPPVTEGIRGIECDAHEAILHGLELGELTWEAFRAELRWQILEDRVLLGSSADPAVRHARPWLSRMAGRRWIAEVILRGERGVEAVDAAVGELLELLEEIGVTGETLVVLTAARGAAPDQANPLGAATLHVPLILANTRLLPHGARYGGIVEGADILPTVIDLLDLELSNGSPRFEGRSFLPGILGSQRGEADDFHPKRRAFAVHEGHASILDGKSQLIVSRELFDRDTLPADDELGALLGRGTSLRWIDLGEEQEGAEEPSRPDLAVVRMLWSELAIFNVENPVPTTSRNPRPGEAGSQSPEVPGRDDENEE